VSVEAYQKVRRGRIVYEESTFGWESQNCGWFRVVSILFQILAHHCFWWTA